jgi:hypothetical protein
MKRVLLCVLAAGLMIPVMAQKNQSDVRLKSETFSLKSYDLGSKTTTGDVENSRSVMSVPVTGWVNIGESKTYDRQAQNAPYQMSKVHKDGFIGATWTNEDNTQFTEFTSPNPKRGVAYTCSRDGGKTWSEVDTRIGGIPLYWPTYAEWGPNGECVLARTNKVTVYNDIDLHNGYVLLTRETKGEGEWVMHSIPFPADVPDQDDEHVLVWGGMTTSGDNNQYIHIVTPLSLPTDDFYQGYRTPLIYSRSTDGGNTWEPWKLVASLDPSITADWKPDYSFTDAARFDVKGDNIAFSLSHMGSSSFFYKSSDNGATWKGAKFFENPIGYYIDPAENPDTIWAPSIASIALDKQGKVHIAYTLVYQMNSETVGSISYFPGNFGVLAYWNEDMEPVTGEQKFNQEVVAFKYSHIDTLSLYDGDLTGFYILSEEMKTPFIGFFHSLSDSAWFNMSKATDPWQNTGKHYNSAGAFSFSNVVIGDNNEIHVIYLGIVDDGTDGAKNILRQPLMITSYDKGATWGNTEYLVNNVGLADQEFSYPNVAGYRNGDVYYTAQTDPFAGTFIAGDHASVSNLFYMMKITVPKSGLDEAVVNHVSVTVSPNPAQDFVDVKFEGKGNISVFNVLGQLVYKADNVIDAKQIPLQKMQAGVYMVTVQTANGKATQKLIVK